MFMWMLLLVIIFLVIICLLTMVDRLGNKTLQTANVGAIFNGCENCAIVVVNNNINNLEFAVSTLSNIFKMSEDRAINFVMRIRYEGVALVWTGDRNEVEHYLQELRRSGLRCFIVDIPADVMSR